MKENLKTLQDEQRPECIIRDDRCGKTTLCLSPFLFSIFLEVFTSVLMKGKKKESERKRKGLNVITCTWHDYLCGKQKIYKNDTRANGQI